MIFKPIHIFCIIFLCFGLAVKAQTPFFHEHTPSGSQLDVKVNSIYQSSEGYIWIASSNGLLRYDGEQYQAYTRPDSASSNHVTAIFEDSSGLIWVGYNNGNIFQFHQQSGLVEWMPEEGTPVVPITGIEEDQAGVLWIATYGEGLYFYKNNRLYNINTDDGLPGNDIYTMATDGDGSIWVGTDGGVTRCQYEEGQKKLLTINSSDGLPDDIVKAIVPCENGNLWIGMYEKGICLIDIHSKKIKIPEIPWNSGVVKSLEIFFDQELWIGTEENGLCRYNFNNNTIIPVGNFQEKARIHDLLKDIEGNIWVLSNNKKIYSANRQFEIIHETPNGIQALVVDSQGQLWVGTQEGLWLKSNETKAFQKLYNNNNIISLYEDEFQNIWMGTFGDGLFCFQPASGKTRRFTEAEGLTNGSILSIDGVKGKLWLATLGGVTQMEYSGDPIVAQKIQFHNYHYEDGLGTNFIYKVFNDSKGRTWFGTDGKGISVLENGKITNYPEVGNIPLKAVYSITEDSHGHIWISTAKKGLFEFDGKHFRQLSGKDGLRNLSITSLSSDENGRIIIVHNTGIDLFDPKNRQFLYYDNEIGLEQMEPNLNASFKDKQGRTWMASQDRIIRYTCLKEQLANNPRTRLQDVSVFLESTPFSNNNQFSHRQNNLVFKYVGLWYTEPAAVKYRYMLEGYNLNWIYSKDRQAVYSNLPPGKYNFKVSSSENNVFSEDATLHYDFQINLPFWQKLWFILMATAVLLGLIFSGIKFRERQLEKAAALKRERIENQLNVLKSQINPHFLFNSFNTLVTIIEENPALAVEYVEQLSDFYRIILQYRKKRVIPLSEEIKLVESYAFLLKKRFGNKLELDIQTNGQKAFIAPLTLQILVENAVKHNVISASKPLCIHIFLKDKFIVVENNLQKKLTEENSTNFGLQSIKDRYALFGKKNVKIEESKTFFKVSIPIIKEDRI